MTDKLEFKSTGDILAHFDKSGNDVEKAVRVYRSQVKEMTGHDPGAPLTPLDVVKIVQKVFFGGADDSKRKVPLGSEPDDPRLELLSRVEATTERACPDADNSDTTDR